MQDLRDAHGALGSRFASGRPWVRREEALLVPELWGERRDPKSVGRSLDGADAVLI